PHRPARPRDGGRLRVLPAEGVIADRHIADLPELLRPGDLLVFNDTKVIPARLVGRRGLATIEVTLARELGGGMWRAYAKGARRLHPGDQIEFAADLAAEVIEKCPGGEVILRFDREGAAFRDALARYGAMPLPPYINRQPGGDPRGRAPGQRGAGARRPHRRGRHDQPAPSRKRRGREWRNARVRRRDPAVYSARLSLSRDRSLADQFPPAALDPADAGRGLGRARP